MRLYLDVGDQWQLANEVLAEAAAIVDLESCTISMLIDGEEHLFGHWNLGRVDLITEQVAACNHRLSSGQPALLRSGVLGRQGVPFHLFEPPEAPDGPAFVSRFFIDDMDVESWFPIPGWSSAHPEDLYSWVDEHRDTLLRPEPALWRRKPPLVRRPVMMEELVAALDGLESEGRAVLATFADQG